MKILSPGVVVADGPYEWLNHMKAGDVVIKACPWSSVPPVVCVVAKVLGDRLVVRTGYDGAGDSIYCDFYRGTGRQVHSCDNCHFARLQPYGENYRRYFRNRGLAIRPPRKERVA